jgi:hypothetical protein
VIGGLLRLWSYLYHLALALFLLGISFVALVGGQELRLQMLPWEGDRQAYWVMCVAWAGLLSLTLALKGRLRLLYALYALGILGLMVWGFFMTPYTFAGRQQFWWAVGLSAGALLAFFGAWSKLTHKSRR